MLRQRVKGSQNKNTKPAIQSQCTDRLQNLMACRTEEGQAREMAGIAAE